MDTRRIVLRFPKSLVDQPIISQLVRNYDLEFNIMRASVSADSEGTVVLGLCGKKSALDRGLAWAREQGVDVQPLSKDVVRDEKRCTDCGACINVCPSGALTIEDDSRRVQFNSNRCIACELCVPACPYRAMKVAF